MSRYVPVPLTTVGRPTCIERAGEDRTAHVYADAILGTMALLKDPTRRALARWGGALVDLGVTGDALREGYGAGYAAALEEFTDRSAV